jgi:hypothetical protein
VHQDAAIQAYDIIPHLDGAFPPGLFYVVFQLYAERPIIVTACQSAIYLAGLKNKASALAKRYNILKLGYFTHNKPLNSCAMLIRVLLYSNKSRTQGLKNGIRRSSGKFR